MFQAGYNIFIVEIMRGCNVDRIDIFPYQELLVIAVKILNPMPLCETPGAFLILTGHGRNARIVHLADRVAEFVCDASCTEDTKPKLLHVERFLSFENLLIQLLFLL